MKQEETVEKINIAKDAMTSQKQSMEAMVSMSENLHTISSDILNKVTQIKLLSDSTDKVSGNVEEKIKTTVEQINQINKRTEDILEHMNFLNKLSEEIINIIDILNDISDQTHILSINAAIEATRTGKEAKAFTENFVLSKEISFEQEENYKEDKFGRTLGYVFVGGVNLNIELVRNGLARVVLYEKRAKIKYQNELLSAEKEARDLRLAIWKK